MKLNKSGFTLIEIIIATAIGLVIIAAVYASVNIAQRSSVSVGRKVITQQDARAVLDIMAMEIRMASLNPSMSRTIWGTIPSNTTNRPVSPFTPCTNMELGAPVITNKGIQIAEPDRIFIAMDLNDPPLSPANSSIGDIPNEYIEYALNDDKNTITRNVSCSGDNDILGGDDLSTNVRNGNDTGIPLFQYFDRNNTPLTAPVSIPDIRRVRITIVADTKDPDSLTGGVKRMIYTTDVLVKNHVLCP
jgi:prepilin-type N-terminal cleavage/methylation domain-containing protein